MLNPDIIDDALDPMGAFYADNTSPETANAARDLIALLKEHVEGYNTLYEAEKDYKRLFRDSGYVIGLIMRASE